MKLYMAVSTDRYELPIAVASSPKELGMLVGDTANRISSSITKRLPGTTRGMRYLVIDAQDDEIGHALEREPD